MRRFSTRMILWSVLTSGAGFLGACSEAMETEEIQAQSINQECEVPEGHDSCREINGEELLTTDAPEAPWRINHGYSENDGHRVTFMAEALNGGLVPMVENQGHYASEEDFRARLSQLLGADLDENYFAQITQVGSTLKMSGDPDTEGFGASTTGILLIDALSDEQGSVFIDGEEFNLAEGNLIEFDYSTSSSESGLDTSGEALLTNQSNLKIKSGSEEAIYGVSKINLFFYHSLGTRLVNYKRDGKGTRFELKPKWGLKWGWMPYYYLDWEIIRVTTNMSITNRYYISKTNLPYDPSNINSGPFIPGVFHARTGQASHSRTESLSESIKWGMFGVKPDSNIPVGNGFQNEIINQVCGFGSAGEASGRVGTFDYCNSSFGDF